MTQELIIKEHLEKHGHITTFEAFELYGITRLSAKIYVLRRQGMEIDSEYKQCINRYGRKIKFVIYTLVGNEDEH